MEKTKNKKPCAIWSCHAYFHVCIQVLYLHVVIIRFRKNDIGKLSTYNQLSKPSADWVEIKVAEYINRAANLIKTT